jgi:hypothetical protein
LGRDYVFELLPLTDIFIVHPLDDNMSMENDGGMILTGKSEELGEKPDGDYEDDRLVGCCAT